ncbi:GNAT family N-acetyltransferase [Glacieibacterium frigidum]|uniref:GNAT family N-acetyltransferase n=1 Tax=Glacieibacterium frigidum TaxID=2593303 RepID=A0A552UJQ4_9SPHN|nr:GNAT family N-acetyltransferase [Glacieibacterium frigidum]
MIRRATAADAALLPAIEQAAGASFAAVPGLEWIADDRVLDAEEHAAAIAAGTAWVADDGGLVGFLTATVASDALHIDEIAVLPDRQGAGIGRQLIATAVEEARARGLSAVTLTTFRDVAWNAPFYARLGFVEASDARLVALLAEEAERRLPGRCAMLLTLR